MAKSKTIADAAPVKILVPFTEGPAFGFKEYMIEASDLEAHAKLIDKSEPDQFAIFLNQLTKKTREIFGI